MPRLNQRRTTLPVQIQAGQWFSRDEGSVSPLLTSRKPKQALFSPKLDKSDPGRLALAKKMAYWMADTLDTQHAKVAIVARRGDEQTQKHDRTGMDHSGLAVFQPEEQKWAIYHLLNGVEGEDPKISRLAKEDLESFFYRRAGKTQDVAAHDGLLIIPDPEVQSRLGQMFSDQKFLYNTVGYSLISPPDSKNSLNCNKWVLLNLMAAKHQEANPDKVLEHIKREFTPAEIKVNPLLRPFAKNRPNIMAEEVPTFGPIQAITVESLHDSEFAGRKISYSGQTF